MNRIKYKDYWFTDSFISSGNCLLNNSIPGDELSIDTLTFTVYNDASERAFILSDADALAVVIDATDEDFYVAGNYTIAQLVDYIYGTPVYYYYTADGETEKLIGKFYVESVKRISKNACTFSCVSAIGLLDKVQHVGGVYSGERADTIINDIVGDTATFIIDPDVAETLLSGWLPYDSCRKNLQQVLFALGASISKDATGNPYITFISQTTPITIADGKAYISGSIDYRTPCTSVEVTEHTYLALAGDETVTLYDEAVETVTNLTVAFKEPMHDLSATAELTIVESGVNYAIVSGYGTLTGQKYTHITNIITKEATATGSAKSVATVTDATMVSFLNSANVADRVLAYYSASSDVSMGLVVGNERPGTEVSFTDPYGATQSGWVRQMDITMSAKLKSDSVIAVGYTPSAHGNTYNNVMVVTEGTSITIPENITKAKAVLIGAGYGGQGGSDGDMGYYETYSVFGNKKYGSCSGGKAGSGGIGGKIYVVEFDVTGGQVISCTIGQGGAGGARDIYDNGGAAGSAGSETTLGSYTSADGRTSPYGYFDAVDGIVYAALGTAGEYGANGGQSALNGVAFETWLGGTAGADDTRTSTWYADGGGGGGASHGNVGANGTDGACSTEAYSYLYKDENDEWQYLTGTNPYALGGTGGAGGNADSQYVIAPTVPGTGGTGGIGGGGGGAGGRHYYVQVIDGYGATATRNNTGMGGAGGAGVSGSAGANGCILIYY